MTYSRRKRPSTRKEKGIFFSLAIIGLLFLVGCGGGNSGSGAGNSGSGGGNSSQNSSCSIPVQPIIHPTNVTYSSDAAFDGSDAQSANDTTNVWLVKTDGSSRVPLTKLTQSGIIGSVHPVLSPDGTRIAFASSRALDGSDSQNTHGTLNIWVMHIDGSGAVPLTKLTANGANSDLPNWSPDSSKIAFVSSRALDGSDTVNAPNADSNLWLVNADGSNATPLTRLTQISTAGVAVQGRAEWSPNGAKLAFASTGATNGSDSSNANGPACCVSNIWVINADGSGALPLTRLNAFQLASSVPFTTADSLRPQWSPDGTKIIFESAAALDGSNTVNTNTNFNIWMVNADGSSRTPLTKQTFSGGDLAHVVSGSLRPVWSPDGRRIAFDSDRALDGTDNPNSSNNNLVNKSNIWSMNADGSCQAPMTKLTAVGLFHPLWLADSATIVYESNRALDGSNNPLSNFLIFNIWVINGDGSNTAATRLTKVENLLAD